MKGQGSRVKGQGFLISLIFMSVLISNAFGETVSSKDLIENAKALDGKTVVYKGEAVTAVMKRGAYSWLNLGDEYNAIGVWCDNAQVADVKFLGGYKVKGDILEVEGVFHRACPVHGGELDIHADKVNIVKSGFPVSEEIGVKKLVASAILFLSVVLIAIIFRKRL